MTSFVRLVILFSTNCMWHSSNRDKPPFHRSYSKEKYPRGSSIFHKTTAILRYIHFRYMCVQNMDFVIKE